MGLFSLEHSKTAYFADFVLYGLAVFLLACFLMINGPRGQWLDILFFVLLGLSSWTIIEYILHRYVLHGLQPFSRWHAQHHQRPNALICTPTLLSASLIVSLVFFPALLSGNRWFASALTLGVLIGYLAYSVTHHAIHHWRAKSNWLKQRKLWHALHHHNIDRPGCYGVTCAFWDHVFGSTPSIPVSPLREHR
ncbi:MAG: sterol desaturase family protein [Formivibrio sp.]|nr:sterol desaturase family protein [Formivibrio sp.]